jgi:hypothetical protein
MVDFIGNVSTVCAVCEELQDRSTGHNKEDIHSLPPAPNGAMQINVIVR